MPTAQPSYIVNARGQRVQVVLDISEYETMLDLLEELEEIRAYDAAEASDERPIPMEEAFADIDRARVCSGT